MKGEKGGGAAGYRMHVMARDAAELTANAGGLIVDRMMCGWRVSVQFLDDADADTRPVRILGAELVDAAKTPGLPDEEQCVLVMAADAYARAVAGGGQQVPTGCAQVLVWGESPDPSRLFAHTLSAAAQSFKSLAIAAADITVQEVAGCEAFTSVATEAGDVIVRA